MMMMVMVVVVVVVVVVVMMMMMMMMINFYRPKRATCFSFFIKPCSTVRKSKMWPRKSHIEQNRRRQWTRINEMRTATWKGQTDINRCKIKNWKVRSKNCADWEKSINESKVRIGL
jgi:hypothetical protein